MVKRLYLEAKFVQAFFSKGAHTYLTLRNVGDMEDLAHRKDALVIRGGPENGSLYGLCLGDYLW